MAVVNALFHEPAFFIAVLALASVAAHAYGFFGSSYSAKQWALRDDRHPLFKGAAYLGALPFRIVFALFSGLVATLVWAALIVGFYLLLRVLRGA